MLDFIFFDFKKIGFIIMFLNLYIYVYSLLAIFLFFIVFKISSINYVSNLIMTRSISISVVFFILVFLSMGGVPPFFGFVGKFFIFFFFFLKYNLFYIIFFVGLNFFVIFFYIQNLKFFIFNPKKNCLVIVYEGYDSFYGFLKFLVFFWFLLIFC